MLSANREDYIKKVFQSNEKNIKLTNKELASSLSVSPASSSEMVKKLIASNHLVKDKEMGYLLTSVGREEALNLTRNHRLWEVFLVNQLGYSWAEVHDEAELLEHVTSMQLGDRLNAFLDRPKFCPHGSIIYGNDGSYDHLELMSSLEVGDEATIRRTEDGTDLLAYLDTRNVMINMTLTIKRIEPFEGPYIVDISGKEVLLSRKAVGQIWVEKQ